ncbi:MFS transporter [Marinobacterium weihaiense]|uniref:MFS transporter n=1 Tax=Marinobacterium weihaiense TaxID=2851016 RepID=A0ABS6M6R8_9GAMM|nr:MFS transporter [Marinobacterium weihaiense]MBV0931930.1 MFS transporter [Marinobacterium weihaiense]
MPYIRLSGFYLFYFALLGTLLPYWSLYLQSLGFSAVTIGWLMGILHVSRVLAPNLWGWLADITGRRLRIIRLGALASWLCFALIFWQQGAVGIALVMAAFSFFWNAVLPQFEVVTLGHLGENRRQYSRIRLWGSVGFILAVVLVGPLLDMMSVALVPFVVFIIMILIWLSTLLIPAGPLVSAEAAASVERLAPVLKQPQVLVFFLVCFLVQLGHGPYYTFYSVLLEGLGYSRGEIGLLWALGVVAEVLLFAVMPRLLGRFSLRIILLISLVLCVVRWGLTAGMPEQLGWMLLAQTLHAATFGSLHAVGIALVQHYFTPNTQGRGQALFSSLGFGAGGALGAVAAGQLWSSMGVMTFALASLVSVLAFVLALIWIYPQRYRPSGC